VNYRRYKGPTRKERLSLGLPCRTRELEEKARTDVSARLRYLLWKFAHRCAHCRLMTNRIPGHPLQATCDHIVPVSLGGPDNKENWQLLCSSCNSKKADTP